MVTVFFSQQRKNDKKSNKVDRGFFIYLSINLFISSLCTLSISIFIGGATNKYILFDGLVCSIVPVGIKIQETGKNAPRYYTINRAIRDLLFNSRCFKIELSK